MALRNTLGACTFVDGLGPAAVGSVVVSDDAGPRGTVFVEGGRVCWAAAHGMARRLSELLGIRASLCAEEMESVFVACREARVPLGEHLLTRGVLSAADLREALLQHTVESLCELWTTPSRPAWSPRHGSSYNPRFTFATAELVTQIGAMSHADAAARAQPMLAELFGEGDWAAAFVRSGAFPEPVATCGEVPHAATTLLRVGKWAASALDVSGSFTDASALLSVAHGPASLGRSRVAFLVDDTIVAGETGAHGPARLLNRRAQRRRAGGP